MGSVHGINAATTVTPEGARRVARLMSALAGPSTSSDLAPTTLIRTGTRLDGAQKLRLVLEAADEPETIRTLCERHQLSEAEFHEWRALARDGAISELDAPPQVPVAASRDRV